MFVEQQLDRPMFFSGLMGVVCGYITVKRPFFVKNEKEKPSESKLENQSRADHNKGLHQVSDVTSKSGTNVSFVQAFFKQRDICQTFEGHQKKRTLQTSFYLKTDATRNGFLALTAISDGLLFLVSLVPIYLMS